MSERFKKIFSGHEGVIIGAVHFPPLVGYEGFPGLPEALKNALADIGAFEKGGADAVIIENNYDLPHTENAGAGTISSMTYLALEIKSKTKLPVGINVLWNDFRAALSIAKIANLDFIRIPVFVDTVETDFGVIRGQADEATAFRSSIGADNAAIFTDIHVKHSKMVSKLTLRESAELAIKKGSDALIVTGKWTGDPPTTEDLKDVRDAAGTFPILCGSGVDKENVRALFSIADGAIVSTSLKKGTRDTSETNVKPYNARIEEGAVRALFEAKGRGR